ncbi:RIP metalloprotease RseP [Candidatus Contubernalis alkaliaceticus]|uniref:RIP metalloprotease RseP n=1 Tax=Candidatus Contubernalis alkaliaceticus TaxID=338645 RepID=UPI001F4C432B|nr:RIP metalloprotease RseP [Candidatus Contubernalis alkalaceticus]UNC91832.1 RIP metalloprotease RseP [Candidatus Contubernalis alkalaceticus]
MTTLVASIVIFGLLIFFHELGHFIVAKRVGIGVLEFAIGFGPKLISVERDGTRYSLRALPLGGFCRLMGEDPEEVEDQASFQKRPLAQRFAVIVAGPLMNFVLAVILFFLIYFFIFGVPSTQVGEVLPDGRAAQTELQAGDVIRAIDGAEMRSWDDIIAAINASPEEELALTIERDGSLQEIKVVPMEEPETQRGLIGIAHAGRKFSLLGSLRLGIENTWFFTRFIVVSLSEIITRQASPDVAGPIGIVQMVGEVAQTGISNLLTLAAILSIHLGLLNLLPIPALDGSRLVFFLLEGIRGKPVDPHKESFIHFVGFTLLILLMILIAFQDIARLQLF